MNTRNMALTALALLATMATMATGCANFRYVTMETMETPSEAPSPAHDIEAIRSSPQNELTILKSGELDANRSGGINLKDDRITDKEDRMIRVPIYLYLVKNPARGYALVDTGCSGDYVGKVYGPMRGALISSTMPKASVASDETTEALLASTGVAPADIGAVYFTHLHFDHTSGVRALDPATRFFVGKGERAISVPLLAKPNHFPAHAVFNMMDFSADYAVDTELGKAIDVFGDGSFWAISTEGHTNGHVSYLVNTADGAFFIAGDAIALEETIETGVGPGTFCADVKKAQKTVDRLLPYLRSHPDITILAGHGEMM